MVDDYNDGVEDDLRDTIRQLIKCIDTIPDMPIDFGSDDGAQAYADGINDWLEDIRPTIDAARRIVGEDDILNTPCKNCGSTDVPLHTNGLCGNCWPPNDHEDDAPRTGHIQLVLSAALAGIVLSSLGWLATMAAITSFIRLFVS